VLGIKIARDSNKKQPVRGGVAAQVIHYLACSGLTGMLPFVIAGLIVGLPFLVLFGTAIGFLVMTGVFLLLLAAFERTKSSPGAAA
jgi:hypothetical protein